jgi:1-deoxy-D-xylulose-5-phosphate reductoisomerase
MIGVTILGSTGSIGRNVLDIVKQHQDQYQVIALSANNQVETLFAQCQQVRPKFAVMANAVAAQELNKRIRAEKLITQVLLGEAALTEIVNLTDVDYVVAAIVGGAGLLPTLAAAKAGKRILLANKEVLVMAGALFIQAIADHDATLLPIDSEHNAIFQCMPSGYKIGIKPEGVSQIILTASGGPFRTMPLAEFSNVNPEQAVKHPNWKMGAKITVDCATMMNKGLEVIEAFWLFNMSPQDIQVVVHPQSIIHSLVEYYDGSLLAQLGTPDMRTPIAHALAWPKRIPSGVNKLDLLTIGQLSFEAVDLHRFPCLSLAFAALAAGGTAATLLNAANEVAVAAFLANKIRFTDISKIISEVLESIPAQAVESFEVILDADERARQLAETLLCSESCIRN